MGTDDRRVWARRTLITALGLVIAALGAILPVRITSAAAAPMPAATAPASPDPRGLWQGNLQGQLRIVVHVASDSVGGLAASLDSPDQGAMGLPVSRVTFANDTLRLELDFLGASFAGRMNDAGTRIEGMWHQSGQSIPPRG